MALALMNKWLRCRISGRSVPSVLNWDKILSYLSGTGKFA